MKNKFIKSLLVSLIVSVSAFAQNQTKTETVIIDKEQIKKEIQARENEFAEIYNSGKIKYVGYYAEDAKVFHQNLKPLIGKAAIGAYLEEDLKSNTNKISFKTDEVIVSNDGLLVTEIGYYIVRDAKDVIINTGNYMCLFEKRNGKYVCIREMSATDMP
jgi:ketosteroid isomerase-like protein